MSAPLFTFRQLPTLSQLLAERDITLAEILRDAGFEETAPTEITAPVSKIQKLLELAAARLGMSMLGVDLAERIPEGAYGVTEFVIRASPTMRHALAAMCELSALINPALDMRYIGDRLGCEIRFGYAGNRDALGPILNEYTVAYIAKQFSVVLREPLPLARAWFAHKTAAADQLAARLACPVEVQAADCGFAVASDVIARAIPAGNEALYKFLLAQAHTQLANLGKHDVISQVTRAIEARIGDADLGPQAVARALSLSQRTLQRQLMDAGTSYRDLLASIRRRRRSELERSGMDEAGIATRLGFGSAKTMRRALDDSGEDPAPDE